MVPKGSFDPQKALVQSFEGVKQNRSGGIDMTRTNSQAIGQPTRTPTVQGYIGRCCKKCETVMRLTLPAIEVKTPMERRTYWMDQNGNWQNAAQGTFTQREVKADRPPDVYCIRHHYPLQFRAIEGVVTECPCDARCTGAKGHTCECSCGGANHGRDYSL
jgi:hypothetical protein